jgi:hypothetical protein
MSRIQMSARRSSILRFFAVFLSLYVKRPQQYLNYATTASILISSNSSFINHPILDATESAPLTVHSNKQ